MVIVFFEYEAKIFFFGVTAGKQITRCSSSHDEVANELYSLQMAEWGTTSLSEDQIHVQGFVLRSIEFVNGRWVVVDVVDGVMTVVAEQPDWRLYFALSAPEPELVVAADEPEDAVELLQQVALSYGG